MDRQTGGPEIEQMIALLSRVQGLGPRSARRAALQLIKRKDVLLVPLISAMKNVVDNIEQCRQCGNMDTINPCSICADERRDKTLVCVVEEVSDLWALERAGVAKAQYHVLGGTLSPIDGRGPEDLNIAALLERVKNGEIKEVLLALNATVEGQSTVHYISDLLKECDITISRLAHGVPVGGELDYLDDGTLATAITQRKTI